MKIVNDIEELIGKTPLVRLSAYEKAYNLQVHLYAKLEFYNPAGSSKDRIAKAMLDDAYSKGFINEKSLIIEPTSGNTGIGLAMLCVKRGLKLILTMPETMSPERIALFKVYGAQIVLTSAQEGMIGAINAAKELAAKNPHSFIPSQFDNPANPAAHFNTTGPEIWHDTDGATDILAAGIGTGGTLSGAGRYLKSKNAAVKLIGIEPAASPFLTRGCKGQHAIQGIGAGFKPQNLDISIIDEIITVSDQEAADACRALIAFEGLFVGISSGAVVFGAKKLALRSENTGKNIVVILPDSGSKYLSTSIYFA